jgi:ATP/maltotriose-dependent transcriptional regulator MalT
MRVQGSVALAANIADSLAALVPPSTLEAGRVLSQRAATSWYQGNNEVSAAQYRQLLRLGRRIGERELSARAMHGLAHVRMSAGNLPAAERLTRHAIRLAGKDFPRVGCMSTLQLAVMHAVRGDFDAALACAWRAYGMSRHFELGRQGALGNIAQILLDAGYPAAARVASKHLLRMPRLRTRTFSHLGTYAASSAALGDADGVEWVAAQLLELAKPPAFAQHAADALLECSNSLEQIGRGAKAKRLRARAHAIAVRHGYHDIAYLAEHGLRRGAPRAPQKITPATEAIVTEVQSLEPENLPLVEIHAG